jgi:succinate-acetate transporter protein
LVRVALIPETSVGVTHSNNNTGFLGQKVKVIKAGGYLGIITALIVYYAGLSEMLTPDDIIMLPVGKYNARG